jgi:hypothetical protein
VTLTFAFAKCADDLRESSGLCVQLYGEHLAPDDRGAYSVFLLRQLGAARRKQRML